MTLSEFYSNESKWMKRGGVDNPNGALCIGLAAERLCWQQGYYSQYYPLLRKAIGLPDNKKLSVTQIYAWNDAQERTFSDIQRVAAEFDRLFEEYKRVNPANPV